MIAALENYSIYSAQGRKLQIMMNVTLNNNFLKQSKNNEVVIWLAEHPDNRLMNQAVSVSEGVYRDSTMINIGQVTLSNTLYFLIYYIQNYELELNLL